MKEKKASIITINANTSFSRHMVFHADYVKERI